MNPNPKEQILYPFRLMLKDRDITRTVVFLRLVDSLAEPFRLEVWLSQDGTERADDATIGELVSLEASPETLPSEGWTFPKEKKTVYKGYIDHCERLHSDQQDKHLYTRLLVYHPLQQLRYVANPRVFSTTTLKELVQEILRPYESLWSKYGVDLSGYCVGDAFQQPLPYLMQYEEDDLHFFLRVCEQFGISLYQHHQTFQLSTHNASVPPPYQLPPQTNLTWRTSQTNRPAPLFVRDTSPLAFSPHTTFPEEPKNQQGQFDPNLRLQEEQSQTKTLRSLRSLQHQTQTIQQEQETYRIQLTSYVYGKAPSQGKALIGFQAGDRLKLPVHTGMKDEIHLDNVVWEFVDPSIFEGPNAHWFRSEQTSPFSSHHAHTPPQSIPNYTLCLYGRKFQQNFPYVPPPHHHKPQIAGYQRAVVVSPTTPSVSDPARLGRIQVEFLWEKPSGKSPQHSRAWIRLAMPFAGKEHGIFVMPEVGDEVVIAFEDGDIDRPLCVGSVYNNTSKYLQTIRSAKRDTKQSHLESLVLKTPHDMRLTFWESATGKQQSIELKVKEQIQMQMQSDDGHRFVVQSDGSVLLRALEKLILARSDKEPSEDDTSITMDQQMFELRHKKKNMISIDQQGNMLIEANSLRIKTRENTEIETGQSLEIKSAKEANVHAKTVHIEAQHQAKLVSSLGSVSVSGSGDVTVEARGLIKIQKKIG